MPLFSRGTLRATNSLRSRKVFSSVAISLAMASISCGSLCAISM